MISIYFDVAVAVQVDVAGPVDDDAVGAVEGDVAFIVEAEEGVTDTFCVVLSFLLDVSLKKVKAFCFPPYTDNHYLL